MRNRIQIEMKEVYMDNILKAVLTVVQDGISFLSPGFDILYMNPTLVKWYGPEADNLGKKCYKAFHGLNTYCKDCPACRCKESKQCESFDQIYEINKKKKGCQKIYCMPIYDDNSNLIVIVEYIRDVTNDAKSETHIEIMDQKVQALLSELTKVSQASAEKEREYVDRANKTVNSVLRFLRKLLDTDSYDFVEKQLKEIHNEESGHGIINRLTPHERAIASYIKEGLVSKEIAEKMHISKKTVDFHRRNIRQKLKLVPEDNLKIKLQEMV